MNLFPCAIKAFDITRNLKTAVRSLLLRALAACLFFIIAFGANASPCNGVDRSLSHERKLALEHKLVKELQIPPSEDIRQSFRYGGWVILHEYSPESDDGYAFYSHDPMTSSSFPVVTWGGGKPQTIEEEQDTKKGVLKNAPDIPPKLAGCFAWYVTFGRDR